MVYFESLFQNCNSNIVDFQGHKYYRYFEIEIENSISMSFRVISTKSLFNQAIVLSFPKDFNGEVYLLGQKISVAKSAFPKLVFWTDSMPETFDVSITDYSGTIKLCNGSDPLGTKQICKHLTAGCAMIMEQKDHNCSQFYCNDHEFDDDCDDLIFEVIM